MKERPILFSGPMVRKLLAGAKTKTRRIVKPQPRWPHYLQPMWGTSPAPNPVDFGEKWLWREVGPDYPDDTSDDRRCPYGIPGDRLWVREAFALKPLLHDYLYGRIGELGIQQYGGGPPQHRRDLRWRGDDVVVQYREHPTTPAELEAAPYFETWRMTAPARWRPGIFMPRWASRIDLEITNVRVERLHDITEEDAVAEGVTYREMIDANINGELGKAMFFNARDAFAYLWAGINGLESWKANPWVWVVEFKRIERERPMTLGEVKAALDVGAKERKLAERALKRSPRR